LIQSWDYLKNGLRRIYLRRKFPTSVIHARVLVDGESVLGRNSVMFRDSVLIRSALGAYSYVQSSTAIYNADIGPFCSIAGGVTIGLAAHPTNMVSTCPVFYDNEQPLPHFFIKNRQFSNNLPRTMIGADVWLGHGVLIKAGVQIGVGAIVGAGSIVTKDIPPYTVSVGSPCREIRQRFPKEISDRLLRSRWWEMEEKELERWAPFFPDPQMFLDRLDSAR
jgi:acetyltransferase-like isoleucine patch superfamily enzyme